jgi:hypothetical protein
MIYDQFDKKLYRIKPLDIPSIAVRSVMKERIPASMIEADSMDFGKVRILPNATTGFVVLDNIGAEIFKIVVGGDDTGDILLGELSGPHILLDRSLNSLIHIGTAELTDLRIDQTPVAETPTPTHTFTINLNGTVYRIPCLL